MVAGGSRGRAIPAAYWSRSLGIEGSTLELPRSELWLSRLELELEPLLSLLSPLQLMLLRSMATALSADCPPVWSRRRWWLATPPLRPASRASSLVHSCAVPFWCAALPPLLAISRCLLRSIDAKPRSSLSTLPSPMPIRSEKMVRTLGQGATTMPLRHLHTI